MKNKNFIMIIGMVLALILIPNVLAGPELNLSVSKYEPYPAIPGQTIKVWVLVQNNGDADARDVVIEAVAQSPFTPYNQESTKIINILGAKKDYLVDFNFKVDDNAVEGNNNLKIKYRIGNSVIQEKNLNIFVQARDSTLSIESVNLDPKEISPGSDGTLTIRIKNTAPSTMTALSMKLQLQAYVGTTLIDLPFAPMDSGTERRLYKLESGESYDFKYVLRAYPDATSKVYKIPFVLTYYDSIGDEKSKTDYVGVIINGEPEISVLIDKTDISKQIKTGSITLKVINKGVTDIKFLNLILQKSDDFDILANSETTYLGNLVSDDYQTADYIISLKSYKDNTIVPITLQYSDANNNYYEKNISVNLNIIDNSKLTPKKGIAGYSWLTLIIILLIGFGVLRYIKNRNKTNKKGQFYQ